MVRTKDFHKKIMQDNVFSLSDEDIASELIFPEFPELLKVREALVKGDGRPKEDTRYLTNQEGARRARIALLSSDEQKELYVASSPFFNHLSWSGSFPANFLTTPTGLEKIVQILKNNNIPINEQIDIVYDFCVGFGHLCVCEPHKYKTFRVPHSFWGDVADGYVLGDVQFVAVNKPLFAIPCIVKRETTVDSQTSKKEDSLCSWYDRWSVEIKNETRTVYEAVHYVLCEKHVTELKENMKTGLLEEDKHHTGEEVCELRKYPYFAESQIIGQCKESSKRTSTLVTAKDPIKIYDPAWITT